MFQDVNLDLNSSFVKRFPAKIMYAAKFSAVHDTSSIQGNSI
jgi:hypothetical protein